jgi:hypothetical protein
MPAQIVQLNQHHHQHQEGHLQAVTIMVEVEVAAAAVVAEEVAAAAVETAKATTIMAGTEAQLLLEMGVVELVVMVELVVEGEMAGMLMVEVCILKGIEKQYPQVMMWSLSL